MSAYKHPPFSACAGFTVSRCIGTCLRTYPPIGGLPPARAKYAEHKRSLCDGCISLSNAEGFIRCYLLMSCSDLDFLSWAYPPFLFARTRVLSFPDFSLSAIHRGVPRSCSYHQGRITIGNSPALLVCPDTLFSPVPVLPLSGQF